MYDEDDPVSHLVGFLVLFFIVAIAISQCTKAERAEAEKTPTTQEENQNEIDS